jgi:ribonuclease Z
VKAFCSPEDYHPELLTAWPIDGDLVMPAEKIPELMKKGMDQAARDRAKAYKVHGLDAN